ncbi:MAG: HlyC/CorC family transporter [Chloroflexi bacterium]|nr:HlyC/CorC family transporter [Chloroflexota bacterium]
MIEPWISISGFAACVAVIAIASSAQTAFSYLNAARLRFLMQRGVPRLEALAEVTQDPSGLSSAVSIVHLSAVTVAVAIAVVAALTWSLSGEGRIGMLAGALLALLTSQTFGRALGAVRSETVAGRLYHPARLAASLTAPLVQLENLLVRSTFRRLFGLNSSERDATTEEDMRVLVDAVEETQALEREEREMITSIFEMSDRDVSEIMLPRVDIVAIDVSTSVTEALDLAVSTGHSRFPVTEGDLDHVLGVVHLRDLAASMRAGQQDQPLAPLARPIHVVPETRKIDELLHDLQRLRTQMALVVDEYGGTAGLVTVEDLLEEIVGEIRDEYDAEEERIQFISEREAIMDAGLSIHDANEALPLRLSDEEYETLAGLVYGELGRVPAAGDLVTLPTCRIKVLSTTGRRVRRVQVVLAEEAGSPQIGA